jgi:hypothetical protein
VRLEVSFRGSASTLLLTIREASVSKGSRQHRILGDALPTSGPALQLVPVSSAPGNLLINCFHSKPHIFVATL